MKHKNILIKQRITITQFFMAISGVVVLFSSSVWETSLVSDILFFLGVILASIATVGRLWCSVYISGYKVNTLVTAGPYSMCRNPLYFFSFLGALGVGLATETLSIPLIILIGFAIQYPYVINKEEKRLLTTHGAAFETYRNRVPRFIPSFSTFKEPEEYVMKPKIFRKRLFDSLWFVWILGILELIEALHNNAVIPTFFKLF